MESMKGHHLFHVNFDGKEFGIECVKHQGEAWFYIADLGGTHHLNKKIRAWISGFTGYSVERALMAFPVENILLYLGSSRIVRVKRNGHSVLLKWESVIDKLRSPRYKTVHSLDLAFRIEDFITSTPFDKLENIDAGDVLTPLHHLPKIKNQGPEKADKQLALPAEKVEKREPEPAWIEATAVTNWVVPGTMEYKTLTSLFNEIRCEIGRAATQHQEYFVSTMEAYGATREEYQEYEEEIRKAKRVGPHKSLHDESIQLASMAIKTILSCCEEYVAFLKNPVHPVQ
jgi:hypothetical protein